MTIWLLADFLKYFSSRGELPNNNKKTMKQQHPTRNFEPHFLLHLLVAVLDWRLIAFEHALLAKVATASNDMEGAVLLLLCSRA